MPYKWPFVLLSGLLPAIAYGDIYMQSDDQEEIYLTNLVDAEATQNTSPSRTAGNKRFKLLIADETKPGFNASRAPKTENMALPFSQVVQLAADNTSLDPALLHAVMQVESNNNPQAVSAKGARGLMQLMPATAKRYAVTNPHDPKQNIAAGARYLQSLQRMFKGDTRLALAAYNAGPNAVIKSGFKIPPFSETQHYVPKVMLLYEKLRDADAL